MKEVIQVLNLAELPAVVGKAVNDLVKEVGREFLVVAVLKMLSLGGESEAPARVEAEPVPIQVRIVIPARNAPLDTVITLPAGMDKKRFPARPIAAQVAVPKRMAMPMLVK